MIDIEPVAVWILAYGKIFEKLQEMFATFVRKEKNPCRKFKASYVFLDAKFAPEESERICLEHIIKPKSLVLLCINRVTFLRIHLENKVSNWGSEVGQTVELSPLRTFLKISNSFLLDFLISTSHMCPLSLFLFYFFMIGSTFLITFNKIKVAFFYFK